VLIYLSEIKNLSRTSKILLTVLALALAGGAYLWGTVYGKTNTNPEIIVQTVTKDVVRYIDKPTIEVVEAVVEKTVVEEVPVVEYIEVEKEVSTELNQFESKEQMEIWLQQDRTDTIPYVKDIFECENFAQSLINHALEDDYYISFQVLKNYTRPDTKEFIEGPHAINSVIIGNYIYFIDPQTDDFWAAYVLEQEPPEA
jgi:hypothetical protein